MIGIHLEKSDSEKIKEFDSSPFASSWKIDFMVFIIAGENCHPSWGDLAIFGETNFSNHWNYFSSNHSRKIAYSKNFDFRNYWNHQNSGYDHIFFSDDFFGLDTWGKFGSLESAQNGSRADQIVLAFLSESFASYFQISKTGKNFISIFHLPSWTCFRWHNSQIYYTWY